MAPLVSSYVRAAARAPRATAYRQQVQAERLQATAPAQPAWLYPTHPQKAAIVQRKAEVARRSQEMPSLAEILTAIRDGWFARYLDVPEPVLDMCVLWALHTHYRTPTPEGGQGHLAFRATPRFFFLSKEPGSGKSTACALLGEVSANYFGLDQEPSEFGIIDAIADEHATVFLDEGDILFGAGARKAGVRSVVQAYTHEVTKKTGRNGGTRKTMFGPIALAALDELATTTGDKLNSTFDRAFVVRMKKTRAPEDPDTRSTEEADIARKALKYVADMTFATVLERAVSADLPIPENLEGRARQISRPILAIAEAVDAASPGTDGDSWLTRAQRACVYFRGTQAATPAQTAELAKNFRDFFL